MGRRPFGPNFRSQLAILQCSKWQGSCLLLVSNTHTPYSCEFYGDVLHEGITHWWLALKIEEISKWRTLKLCSHQKYNHIIIVVTINVYSEVNLPALECCMFPTATIVYEAYFDKAITLFLVD